MDITLKYSHLYQFSFFMFLILYLSTEHFLRCILSTSVVLKNLISEKLREFKDIIIYRGFETNSKAEHYMVLLNDLPTLD